MKLSELIEKYVELRDKKSQIKAEYDMKKGKIDESLDKIESALLKTFDTAGLDSIKTEFGTAYISTVNSASVADKDAFMAHVKTNEDWHLMEVRCSKLGIEQYKEVHDELPPGVNWHSERNVNIRRS